MSTHQCTLCTPGLSVQADFETSTQANIARKRRAGAPLALRAISPLVYSAYQHTPHKQWAERPLREHKQFPPNILLSSGSFKLYPNGFSSTCDRVRDDLAEQPAHLKDTVRGEIKGFSYESASRLRQFMLKNWRKGATPYAVTLTTQGIYSPTEWESIVKRFRSALARKHPEWAACWRVELQRRKTPHLHCVFWMDEKLKDHEYKLVLTRLWIQATREDSVDVWKYSVHVKDLTGASAWIIYCTLHDTKHKKEQLGWTGRQWGIWNKKAWQEREPEEEHTLTRAERIVFVRRLRAWSRGRIKGKRVKPLRLIADRNLPAFAIEAATTRQLLRGIVPK